MMGHSEGVANNGFGRRSLHQWEAGLLHMAGYSAPPDFRVPGGWRLIAGGVPIPPLPVGGDELDAAIDAVWVTLSEEQCAEERYLPDNFGVGVYFPKSISNRLPGKARGPPFSSGWTKTTQSHPGSSFSPGFGLSSIRRAQVIPGSQGSARGVRTKRKRGKR
jgi:hypothetical protein